MCSWRRLPLICLKLLVGVCVRDTLAASVCVYHTYAASVEHLPPGWRAVAFPRWFHDQSCSTWQCHSHSHCSLMLLRRLVCTRQACCLFARVALLLLPSSFFLGVRVPSLSHGRFMNFQLLDVAHCSFSHQLFVFRDSYVFWVLASLALIQILLGITNTNTNIY